MRKYVQNCFWAVLCLMATVVNAQTEENPDLEVPGDPIYEVDQRDADLFREYNVSVLPARVKPNPKLPCDDKWYPLKKEIEIEVPGVKNTTEAKKAVEKILALLNGTQMLDDYLKKLFDCDICPPLFKGCDKEVKDGKGEVYGGYKNPQGKFIVKVRFTWKARCTRCKPDIKIVLLREKSSGLDSKTGVFPNPTRDYVNIHIKFKNERENLDLIITDFSGRALIEKAFDVSGVSEFENKFDLGHLPPGVYLVTVIIDQEYISTEKLIVE